MVVGEEAVAAEAVVGGDGAAAAAAGSVGVDEELGLKGPYEEFDWSFH